MRMMRHIERSIPSGSFEKARNFSLDESVAVHGAAGNTLCGREMKTFGYVKAVAAEEDDVLLQLREVSFLLTPTEIDVLIKFLQNARVQFAARSPVSGQAHLHLRDLWKKWKTTDTDVIVVYSETEQ
jgi:hypothetical protein